MRVKYIGPWPSVMVLGVVIDQGAEADLPDDVVLGDDFEIVKPTAKVAKKESN